MYMAPSAKQVGLSEIQLTYLKGLEADAELPPGVDIYGKTLQGLPEALESLRDKLTELLAKRGFNDDYSTTDEGALIEDLIDVLHSDYAT